LLGALLAGSVQLGVPAAHAACPPHIPFFPCNGVVVEGSGTIAPGLPCSPCTIDFNFTAVAAGSDSGVYSGCNFHGTSPSENELGGSGSGTLSGCAASGTVTYNRTGALVQVSGSASINGGQSENIGTNLLLFIPTSAQPTSSFIVVGAVVVG
jgi:hypothetical protein